MYKKGLHKQFHLKRPPGAPPNERRGHLSTKINQIRPLYKTSLERKTISVHGYVISFGKILRKISSYFFIRYFLSSFKYSCILFACHFRVTYGCNHSRSLDNVSTLRHNIFDTPTYYNIDPMKDIYPSGRKGIWDW